MNAPTPVDVAEQSLRERARERARQVLATRHPQEFDHLYADALRAARAARGRTVPAGPSTEEVIPSTAG